MKVFSVVKDGVVVNTIMWDGKDNSFSKDIDGDLIESDIDQQPGIGWVYAKGKFSPPPEPEKSHEELVVEAEMEREGRLQFANSYMNSKQWPGKAAIGRLKGDELAQYNLWLDHLDALVAVDTTAGPNIFWPTPPL
ncbi:tail fiber assembly protein [Lelliottia amnigena]|uniref:tail fiber assembly protein n=1 Tax=Lelliottia amnigena TaxID=61646 RepID=UPI00293B9F20|nr:tail fiber assembly protein [Lelliottia amnigena]